MANYLVTGSAGFIGSKVTELLVAGGHTVTGVDNLNDAYDVRLKRWRLGRLENASSYTFKEIDICDTDKMRKLFTAGYDAVVNLAARAGGRQSVENPWVYYRTNMDGTLNLLELCREFGVGKFVLSSTSSAYGDTSKQPFNEDDRTDRPLSPYAASKKGAEALCYTYHFLHGIDVTVFRYFTVYGPAGRPDMSIFRFVRWITEGEPVVIYGDGSDSRDYTYVDDIARGTVAGLKPVGYEIVNLGSNSPITVQDVVQSIEHHLNKTAKVVHEPRRQADVPATWANVAKAKRLLGWSPQTLIGEGVPKVSDWYLENREWAKDISVSDK